MFRFSTNKEYVPQDSRLSQEHFSSCISSVLMYMTELTVEAGNGKIHFCLRKFNIATKVVIIVESLVQK